MSQETRGLRRLLLIVRRPWAAVGAAATLSLLVGAGYAALSPPLFASKTIVVLPVSAARFIGAQVAIAGSDPVLAGATRQVDPPVSLQALRGRVQVTSLTSSVLSISARGTTAAQAMASANAVANSYLSYLSSVITPGGRMQAKVLETATPATRTPLSHRLLITGGLGALLGALIGVIGAIAFSDRRLPVK